MNMTRLIISFIILLFLLSVSVDAQQAIRINGKVVDELTQKPLKNVSVQILNSNYGTSTNSKGEFALSIPRKKHFTMVISLLGYTKRVKELDVLENQDSVYTVVLLPQQFISTDTVSVFANLKPDTLVGAPNYGVYDFEFYEDKYILLTAEKNLTKAELKLADEKGKILTTYFVPKEGGEAKEFFKDYLGYTNLICKNLIYRVNLYHDRFLLTPLNHEDVNAFIRPIIDTVNNKLIFSDYWKEYPQFNYYTYNLSDRLKKQLCTVENKELMDAYNFEYYALKPREKLEARRMAADLKTDKRIVAALMSGFTKSMFYEPLFAPLYLIKDTICVFDHYKDYLYHFDKHGAKIDSFAISYNHPKNWREWKHRMLKDDLENTIYAVYDKNGHKYVKQIHTGNGKEQGKYTLQFHSADKLKIHNGYAYYVYRPFESTQEKFFYRELIKLNKVE